MSDRTDISSQIKNLTQLLVEKSIAVSQNYPVYRDNKLFWENFQNIAFALKDEPYESIYEGCKQEKDYSFMLIDGALIQLQYEFRRNELVGHVLTFFPNPHFENYQDNPEEFEELYFGQELFTDMVNKKSIVFPIRFDYTQVHNDVIHPKIHATLGAFKDCRIPISKPISPNRFISFILRNFYYFKFIESDMQNELNLDMQFPEIITNNEKKLLHLNHI